LAASVNTQHLCEKTGVWYSSVRQCITCFPMLLLCKIWGFHGVTSQKTPFFCYFCCFINGVVSNLMLLNTGFNLYRFYCLHFPTTGGIAQSVYRLLPAGRPSVRGSIRHIVINFMFSAASKPSLLPTRLHMQRLQRAKPPVRESDHPSLKP
jgi:hypothetical protein